LSRENEDYIQEVREDVNYSKNRSFIPRFPSQTYYVAAVTVANGGDNIGIYTSLFANNYPMHVLIIMIIFYLMMGIWCALAYFLITHPRIAKVVTNYGHKISPFIYSPRLSAPPLSRGAGGIRGKIYLQFNYNYLLRPSNTNSLTLTIPLIPSPIVK